MMKHVVLVAAYIFLVNCRIQCSTNDSVPWRSLFTEDQLRILYQNNVSSLHRTTDIASEGYHGFVKDLIRPRNPKWTNSTVRYHIAREFANLEEITIKHAIQSIVYATNSCISFIEMKQSVYNIDHIRFMKSHHGCESKVGRIGGVQMILLDDNCMETKGIIEHKIMHALGFHHEHQREDRDSYISVQHHNIKPGFASEFTVIQTMDTFGLEYDYESVMHYPANAFTKHNSSSESGLNLTIIPRGIRNRGKVPVTQAPILSRLDIERIKRVYCPEQLAMQSPRSHMETTTTKGIKTMRAPLRSPYFVTYGLKSGKFIPIGHHSITITVSNRRGSAYFVVEIQPLSGYVFSNSTEQILAMNKRGANPGTVHHAEINANGILSLHHIGQGGKNQEQQTHLFEVWLKKIPEVEKLRPGYIAVYSYYNTKERTEIPYCLHLAENC